MAWVQREISEHVASETRDDQVAEGNAPRPHPLLADLNAPQREAVTHVDGPLLILAGPGSGKTRVITRRIAWLLTEGGVRPSEILAITFTNKAAREMKERVEKMLPTQGMWIGTFHATCARILRREIGVLPGYTRDFSIYDTHDKNQLLKTLLKESDYDTTRFRPAMVGGWISDRKNRGWAENESEAELALGEDGIEHEVLVKIEKLYAAGLTKNNALDFDDLLLKVLEIFERHPGISDQYSSRFRHVMVDEYQDTNRVQYLITRHFAKWHGNLAVCGDPDQSIYAWRGADIRNILDFETDFGAPVVVKLEQNYRSTGVILQAAQAVIRNNRGRKAKEIWTDAGEGHKLTLRVCADENDEAREIARQIHDLREHGQRLDGIAVFYRVNFMQRALESALRLARIPYQVIGGLEFYERREIRDLIAYLKLIVNPSDAVAFRRVVNVPQRGVGDKSLETLVQWAADRRLPLHQAVLSQEALSQIRGRARTGLAEFGELLARLEPLREQDAALALDQVLEAIDVGKWFAEMDDQSGVDREANVEELRAHAAGYDRLVAGEANAAGEVRLRGLRGFLQEIALVNDTDALEESTEKVTLMTLHSAKGLEFPVVFIAGVEEELLPHSRAVAESLGDDSESGVEEERRLFYVGLTRARERVVLTHTRERTHFGQMSFRTPSRFLEEIPPELIEGSEPDRDEEQMLGAFDPPPQVAEVRVGDHVDHAHFGRGTVERLVGMGINARATVRFSAAGTRELLLQYANLKVIGRSSR
jgi:DNA helicase-2/ATP-dependent DNA helicase PcrA